MERLSEREDEEIARLAAAGLASRLIGQQIGRHHRTVWGHIARLRRPLVPERLGPTGLSLSNDGHVARRERAFPARWTRDGRRRVPGECALDLRRGAS